MKKKTFTAFASLLFLEAPAQPVAPSAPSLLQDPMLPFYLLSAAMIILLALVVAIVIYAIRVLNLLTGQAAAAGSENAARSPARASSWKRFIERINASVPVEHENEIELSHSFDGIKELDNHLPPWWKWLFYGSIAWGVIYLIIYHVSDTMPLSLEEYHQELALAEERVRQFQATQPRAEIDENTLQYEADPAILEKGKAVFTANNCGGCHRADGGGNTIGPNLTDEYWLHGGELKDVFLTIRNGVVEKGMPAWGKSMSAQDVRDVTFYVISLQGTNPPDAKAPQGEISIPRPQTASDTLKTQAGL